MSSYFGSLLKQSGVAPVPIHNAPPQQQVLPAHNSVDAIQPLEQDVFMDALAPQYPPSLPIEHVVQPDAPQSPAPAKPNPAPEIPKASVKPAAASAPRSQAEPEDTSRISSTEQTREIESTAFISTARINTSAQTPPLHKDTSFSAIEEKVVFQKERPNAMPPIAAAENQSQQPRQEPEIKAHRKATFTEALAEARTWVAAPFKEAEAGIQEEAVMVLDRQPAMIATSKDPSENTPASIREAAHQVQDASAPADPLHLSIGSISVTIEPPASPAPLPAPSPKKGSAPKANPHAKSRLRRRYFRF